MGKESACSAGDASLIPRSGRFPGGGHGNPLQYSCLKNPHGQKSLLGYSPYGHKKLDTTEVNEHACTVLVTCSWIQAIRTEYWLNFYYKIIF